MEILIPFPNFWWYTEPQKTGKNQPLKTVPLIIYNYLKHKRSQLLKKSEQNCSYQGKTLNFLTAFKGLWNSFVFEKVTKFPKNCTKSLNFRFFFVNFEVILKQAKYHASVQFGTVYEAGKSLGKHLTFLKVCCSFLRLA